mgnify:CR=1 FL=1
MPMHQSNQGNVLSQNLLWTRLEIDCEEEIAAIIALPLIILQMFKALPKHADLKKNPNKS